MTAFRSALLQDIHDHQLTWSVILACAIASAILWACIAGVPLVHEAPFSIRLPLVDAAPA